MTRRGGDAETRRARNRIGIPLSPCPLVGLIPQLSDTPGGRRRETDFCLKVLLNLMKLLVVTFLPRTQTFLRNSQPCFYASS
jgi:hypothetical protein